MSKFRLIQIVVSLLLAVGVFAAATAPASAATPLFDEACKSGSGTTDSTVCKNKDSKADTITGSGGIIVQVTTALALVGGVIAVIIIIVQGFRFVLSNGNADQVSNARNGVIYAVIGLIVIIVARTIVVFIVGKL